MKKRFIILIFGTFIVNVTAQNLDTAIKNKYSCPNQPAQFSVLNTAIQLTGPTTVNQATIDRSNRIGRLILQYTNEFRAQNGRPALSWDQFLAQVARPHTVAMARGNAPFSHAGFDTRLNWYRSKRPGTVSFGENLAYFFNSSIQTDQQIARYVVNLWISSPEHRANLLGNFNRMGAAEFRNIHNVWYLTQLFSLVR